MELILPYIHLFFRNESVSECQYRCLFMKKEFSYDIDNWRTLTDPIPINCDFVETQCFKENIEIFRYVHMQVGGLGYVHVTQVPLSLICDLPESC